MAATIHHANIADIYHLKRQFEGHIGNELEVRVCNVTRFMFQYTLAVVRQLPALTHEQSFLKHVAIYNNNIRKIDNEPFERKLRLGSVLLHQHVKIVLSREEPAPHGYAPDISDIPIYRDKSTTRLHTPTFFYDFSILNDSIYEIEIEFMRECSDDQLIDTVRGLLSTFNDIHQIISDCNTILQNPSITEIAFDVNKPVNLKSTVVLENYMVCLKHDGIRMLLVNHPIATFLFNTNQIMLIEHRECTSVSIIDVEYCKDHTLFAFDIVVYKNTDTRFKMFAMRYNYLQHFTFVHTVRYTTDLTLFTHELLDSGDYDGLVFTPTDKFYNNASTYKWKPCKYLTVDLKRLHDNSLVTADGIVMVRNTLQPHHGSSIAEYTFSDGDYIFYRARPDKKFANSYKIVQDVLHDLAHPISLEQLRLFTKFKHVHCIDKMNPVKPSEHCYYTRAGKLKNIIRTGLVTKADDGPYSKMTRALVKSYTHGDDRIIDENVDSSIKLIHDDYTNDEFLIYIAPQFPCLLQKYIAQWYNAIDSQSVIIKFVFENIISIDTMSALIPLDLEDSPNVATIRAKFMERCLQQFEDRMGYATQRVKIDKIRKEYETMLNQVIDLMLKQAMDAFKKSRVILLSDVEKLLESRHTGICIMNANTGVVESIIGNSKKCIVLIKYMFEGIEIIELLGKINQDNVINRFFDKSVDDIFQIQ